MHGVQILTQLPVFAFDYLVHTLFPGYPLNQFCAVVTVSDWFIGECKGKTGEAKNNLGRVNCLRSTTLHLNVCIRQMLLSRATNMEVYSTIFKFLHFLGTHHCFASDTICCLRLEISV